MAYSTKTDLSNQLTDEDMVQLTSETGPVDDAQIAQAIADADAEMDAYLGAVYPVPVSPVTDLLTKLSVDIAVYNLFSRRSIMVDIRRQRYEDAIALLKNIAKGLATIGKQEAPAQASDLVSSERIFSRDTQRIF